ncbi:hypothetical protein [Bacillus haynesii]|uniref:hypothetical protein n=1 Tax=Bacillus haynesii TaxID=1925021 RepID=UPI0003EDA41D|nr:hypothetical protein [Bacillus haynesii]EWH19973.1 hypothetical protein M769_0123735 [Bacillus haynesii]
MGLLILLGIVFVATVIMVMVDTSGELILSIIVGVVVDIVLLLIVGAIVCANLFDTHKVLEERISIYSIKDTSNISGQFVLGSGTVNEQQYFYFVSEKEGFKSVDKVSTDSSRIKEGNYKKPYMKKYKYEYDNKFVRFMLGKTVFIKENSYDFYLPENTVTQEYKVDLE